MLHFGRPLVGIVTPDDEDGCEKLRRSQNCMTAKLGIIWKWRRFRVPTA
jgi:hypothetical protein